MDGMEGGNVLIPSFQKTNSQEIRLPGICIFKTQTTFFCLSLFFNLCSGGLNSTFQPFLHMILTSLFLDYVTDLSTDHVLVISFQMQHLKHKRSGKDMNCFNQFHIVWWLVASFSF